jgi:hypothetical protein
MAGVGDQANGESNGSDRGDQAVWHQKGLFTSFGRSPSRQPWGTAIS